jgi:hypothetical protein
MGTTEGWKKLDISNRTSFREMEPRDGPMFHIRTKGENGN